MIGRIQHPKYTAAALKAANPLLLDGEVVYESDTGRHKIGDGVNKWTELPYPMNAEAVPAVTWKVQGGMLCVKPATESDSEAMFRGHPALQKREEAIPPESSNRADTKPSSECGVQARTGLLLAG